MTNFDDGTHGQERRNHDHRPLIHRRLKRPLTLVEEQQLWDACPADATEDRLLLTLMLTLGLRPREVCALTRMSFRADSLQVVGKDGQQRTIRLESKAAETVGSYLELHPSHGDADGLLLHPPDGRPLDVATLTEFVHKLGVRARLDWRLGVHDLRYAALLRAAATQRKFGK
jgi:integrase